jgi:predicted RNA-binding protein
MRGYVCELTVYIKTGEERRRIMEGVVRLVSRDEKVLLVGILGDSAEVPGRLDEIDMIAQEATVAELF